MEEWKNPSTIALWILITLILVLILVVAITMLTRASMQRILRAQEEQAQLEIQHREKLIKASIQVQERERNRIAADLHDELIGKLNACILCRQAETDDQLSRYLHESIAIARRISHDLRPPLLEHASLHELITALFEPLEKRMEGVELYQDVRGDVFVSGDQKVQLVRIVQEAITNSVKHAKATLISAHLRITSKAVCVRVWDNGKGFDPRSLRPGLGLKNIEMRIDMLNGRYRINSTQGTGTSTLFYIPI